MRTMIRTAAACLSLVLVACGSEGPPPQEKTETPSLTGTATYGLRVVPGDVAGKGVAGLLRTAANSSGTDQYTMNLTQLTAPYVLRYTGGDRNGGVFLYSVATQAGIANITPLTTLLIAQLFGMDPSAAYASFGANGGVQASVVTEANLRDAQAKVVTYLQDVLGVQVKSGANSFITSPFSAVAGDPMLDTLEALDAKLVAQGLTFDALSTRIALEARLCLEEKILVSVVGQQKEFCPATKIANPEEADNTIFAYVFQNSSNDTLTVRTQNGGVLTGEYATAGGVSYTCAGVACGAISLGTPAQDLTRSVTFRSAELVGANTNAMLNGTLMGPIPGIALPVLPCDNDKYFVILEDRTVIADCVDTNDPLNLGGTLPSPRGAEPSRAVYRFANSNSTNPAGPEIEVVTDGNDSLLSVFFHQVDPETGDTSMRYVCEAAGCNGVTLGPVTVNTDLDPSLPVLIRRVTFDDTILAGLNEDGSATNLSATLKASFTTLYFVDPNAPLRFPDPMDCTPGSDAIAIADPAAGQEGEFNFCSEPSNRSANPLSSGEVELIALDDFTFLPISVVIDGNTVVRASYRSPVELEYYCMSDCTGIAVSAPDELGNRTVTLTDAVLRERQSFPRPGPRTATLNGSLVFPP